MSNNDAQCQSQIPKSNELNDEELASSSGTPNAVDADPEHISIHLSRPISQRASQSGSNELDRALSYERTSQARKNVFMVFIVLTQLVQMIPFGAGINTGLSIATSLHFHDQHSTQVIPDSLKASLSADGAWIAASYPLTQGTFVLIGGRLGAVYGHKRLLIVGCAWWVIWSLGTGFANNLVALCFMRGLTGMGGGIMVPNAVALLGINFPPGRQRNLAIGLFGAMAPVGAAGGSLIAGIIVQLTQWKWLFFFLAVFGFVTYTVANLSIPNDPPPDPDGQIDWVGACLGVAGLILFNFVWNQAPTTGWDTPYIYTLLIVSILSFIIFVLWESRVAASPILPLTIWKAPSFGLLMVVIFIAFMSLGIFIWYQTLIMIEIRGASMILAGVQFLPLTILGTVAAFLAAWLVSRLPAQAIIGIGCTALLICNLLVATTPRHQTYWAMLFPATICSAFTADLIFAASQIIASNSVGRQYQGVAGSLVGTLLTYGLSTGLGFAGTVEVHTNSGGANALHGYRMALWLAVGMAGGALIVAVIFIRMPKNDQDGWDRGEEIGVESDHHQSAEKRSGEHEPSSQR